MEPSYILHTVISHLCTQHEQRLDAALLAGRNKLAPSNILQILVPNKPYGFCGR